MRRLALRRSLGMAALVGPAAVGRGHQQTAAPFPAAAPHAIRTPRLRLPPLPIIVTCLYVMALTAAELTTAFTDARWGLTIHITLLAALLAHASLTTDQSFQRLFLALALAPVIRILSLTMPLENVDLVYWYAIVGAPMMLAAFVVAMNLKLSREDLGLTFRALPIQGLIALSGLGFGVAEYFILRPEPLIDELSWRSAALPAVILLVGTGFNEEFVFRGVMQSASRQALGKLSILYVAVVFAILHVGYKSVTDVAFVFAVGLLFGWLVARTRSLLGATLSHGITNIALYLVVPFLGIAAATVPATGVQNVEEFAQDFSREVQHIQALIPPPQVQTPAPTTTPSATPVPSPTPRPAEPEGPAEETYTVQPGDSLADIAALYSTTVEELLRLNDLPEPNLLYAGQSIVVPQQGGPPPGPSPATAAPEPPPTTASPEPSPTPRPSVHVVEEGDTLSAIAERYGTTVDELLRLNDLPDLNNIPVGQSLILPGPP